MQDNKISPLTFSWLWSNQRLSLKYERDDFLLMHWENAHQFYEYQLQFIQPQHSEDFEIVNQAQINTRSKERNIFFAFHTILGALILFLRKYNTLRKIFNYTQSIPPRYALLPERMDEIFVIYFKLSDSFDEDFSFISNKFPFPDFNGLHADEQIKEQICIYLALLFLRQYSIVPYLTFQQPLSLPSLPQTQGEKKSWLEHLPYFKKLVEKNLQNMDLLTGVDLDFITNEYCETNKKKKPIELLEEFEKLLRDSIEEAEISQAISHEKEEKFMESTKRILKNAFEEYNYLNSVTSFTGEVASNFINGTMQVYSKNTFADSQGFSHLNYDSFLASTLSEKFKRGISESFFFHKTEYYLFKSSDINSVLDKLNIQGKNFAIVGFRYEVEDYPVKIKNFYKDANHQLLERCLFVIKEEDLPCIFFNDTKEEYKIDYKLQKIDDKFNLYASLIDLNTNNHLHKEIKSPVEDDIRKQVLATIFINAEIRWKKNIKCVFIQIASPYREEGILSNLTDVKPF